MAGKALAMVKTWLSKLPIKAPWKVHQRALYALEGDANVVALHRPRQAQAAGKQHLGAGGSVPCMTLLHRGCVTDDWRGIVPGVPGLPSGSHRVPRACTRVRACMQC